MAAGKIFAISFAINAIMGGTFSSATSRASAAMASLRERTSQLNAEQRRLDAAWRSSQAATAAYGREIQRLKAQYDGGKISESQYNAAVARAAERMRAASMSASDYRNNMQRLRAEIDQAAAAQARLRAATAAQVAASAKFQAARNSFSTVATVGGMVAAPFIGAIETAANFEAAMSKVKAITRSSDADMQQLTANARMLGETTQFSATQAAEAMSYLGMAGWNASQIISGMPGLLALAAAGGTDLARTADIISDDLTAFGLSADQAGHMADVFAVTVTRTNTNVEMLGETMKYAAPVAKAFGASMEETAALAGIMANSGIKASQAGTALRAGFLRLAGPPKMATKAMQELGLSLSDVTAQQQEAQAAMAALGIQMSDDNGPRKMSAILTELRDKTADLGQEEKLATLKAIFGTEAATGWLAVLDAGPETFNNLVAEMENCDGEAQKMAETMMDNAKGAWIKLKSAVEGLAISIGSIFLPALTNMGNGLANAAGAASQWVGQHEAIVQVLGEVIAGATAAAFAFASWRLISSAIDVARTSLELYRVEIMGTETAQRLMTLATAAQARAMALLRAATSAGTYRRLAQEAAAAYAQMRAITWASIGTQIRAGVASGVSGATSQLARLRAAATAAAASTRAGIASAMSSIASSAASAGQAVLAAARNFTVAGALSTAANGFRALGTAILGAGRAALAFAFSPIGIALLAIAGAAYLIYSNWEQVGPFFEGLWAQIQAAFAAAWAMISPALDALGAAFMTLEPAVMALGETFMAAFDQITAAVMANSGPLSELANIGLMIAEIFGGVLVGALIVAADVMVGVITGAVQMVSSIITMLIGVLTGLINFISAVFTGNWSAAWSAAGSIVTSIFQGVLGTIRGFISGIMSAISNVVSSARSLASSLPFGGGGGGVESNAEGGIYRKGAFLTTFAEEGPEAAIPLDRSQRAIGLWRRAGEILGMGDDAPALADESATRTGSARQGFSAPPISISLTFNGPTDAAQVRAAVEDAGQQVQKSFAEQMEEYKRGEARLAYV